VEGDEESRWRVFLAKWASCSSIGFVGQRAIEEARDNSIAFSYFIRILCVALPTPSLLFANDFHFSGREWTTSGRRSTLISISVSPRAILQ
jgi:hypothetical protein